MPSCPPVRIVVAVDFGDASAAAITLAGRLAPRLGATLTAVHAESFEVPPYFTREGFARLEREMKMARGVAETELRRFVTRHTDTDVEVRVVDGPAVDAVLDAGGNADLIVMGTHGRRGPTRWWLGSIAERVVREAPVPVLVVHAPADPHGDGARAIVVLGGEADTESRQWGAVLAETLGVPVRDGPPPEHCDATAMTDGAIVVVPVEHATDTRSVHPRIAALARTCPVPVLFVPTG